MPSACHAESHSFSRAGGQPMEISTAAAQPQPPSAPPPRTWSTSPISPRTRNLALGQALGLFMTFYLRVCALALRIQEISTPAHQSTHTHTHTSLSGEEVNSGPDTLASFTAAWVALMSPYFGSFFLVCGLHPSMGTEKT